VRSAPRISVDPRRKLGRHTEARRLLADAEVVTGSRGAWHDLVSALQRHTVHNELAQLPRDDRHILSLAYVHGHSNREIAAMLDISVRTVSRRLTSALARLEESARRAGAWVSILGLAVVAWSARLAAGARSTRVPGAAALVAAGTVGAVAVGFVAVGPGTPALPSLRPPVFARTMPPTVPALARIDIRPAGAVTKISQAAVAIAAAAAQGLAQTASGPVVVTSRVCNGNPTSAAPIVPVGHRPGAPPPQPVTHPGPGGCGH
jgi:sigma-70-like protein